MLLVWLSSEFGPPCSWRNLTFRIVPAGKDNGFSKVKTAFRDWLRRPGPDVDAPCRVVAFIDRIFNRTGHAALSALVLEDRFQFALRRVHIRGSLRDFDLGCLLRSIRGRCLHFEFGQAKRAFGERPGPPSGRFGSVKTSSRIAVTGSGPTFTVAFGANFVGA